MNFTERKSKAIERAIAKNKWSPRRVKLLREVSGLSQNEFSSLLGIHQSTLAKYEKGKQITSEKTIFELNVFAKDFKKNKLEELFKEIDFISTF